MSIKMAAIDLLLCIIIAVLHLLGVPLISENIGSIIFGTFIIRFIIGTTSIIKICYLWNKNLFNTSNLILKKNHKCRRILIKPK